MVSSQTDRQRIASAISKLTQSLTEYSELILDILDHQDAAPSVEKKKKEKDPNAPKRNLSSYMLYSQAIRSQVVSENPEMKAVDVAKLIGEKWNALSDKEKQPYVKAAAKEKARFDKENKNYLDGLSKKSEAKPEPVVEPAPTEETSNNKRKAETSEPKKKSSSSKKAKKSSDAKSESKSESKKKSKK